MQFSDIPVRGIDVSEFNGVIDWSKVTGCDFTAIRVGHGRVTDKKFKVNWAGAKGKTFRIPYWYMDYYSNHMDTSAKGISDADWGKLQAEKYWELVKGDPEGIVFLDIESASVADKKINEVWDRVETIAKAFLERADELSGKTNGVYCSLSLTSAFSSWFRERPLWVAWYSKLQTPESVLAAVKARGWTGKCLIWQYASDGDLDGDGTADGLRLGMQYKFLDLNMWLGTMNEFKEWLGGQQMADILLPVQSLAQRDPRWANIKLGTSSQTIGNQGCLLTAWTMLANFLLKKSISPAEMNEWLKANGGYHDSNLFLWDASSNYDERLSFAYRYNAPATDKVDASLAKGVPVIVNVDMYPNTPAIDQHWILVIGKVNGSYIINDPWFGAQLKFEEWYGDPKTGMRVVCTYKFTGETEPIPEPEPLPVDAKYAVTLVNLNVRKAPGGSIWATAPKGTKFEVLEIKGDWVRVGWQQWVIARQNGFGYLKFEAL